MNKKNLTTEDRLKDISIKYSLLEYNEDNLNIGGGLSENLYASNRHEDARNDKGKLTLGEATRLFKQATNERTDLVRKVIQEVVGVNQLEWHHAGLIKGTGKMGITYHINCNQIVDVAKNFLQFLNQVKKKQQEEVYIAYYVWAGTTTRYKVLKTFKGKRGDLPKEAVKTALELNIKQFKVAEIMAKNNHCYYGWDEPSNDCFFSEKEKEKARKQEQKSKEKIKKEQEKWVGKTDAQLKKMIQKEFLQKYMFFREIQHTNNRAYWLAEGEDNTLYVIVMNHCPVLLPFARWRKISKQILTGLDKNQKVESIK